MRRFPILVVFFLVLAACGDSGSGSPFTQPTAGGTDATITTGGTDATITTSGATSSTSGLGAGFGQGDSDTPPSEGAMLEELRSRCAAGEFVMCDILFLASPLDSELERFAYTCGDVASEGGACTDRFGVPYELGQLRADCGGGDMVACDLLYLYSPFDSADEAFGDDCGGLGEGGNLTCVVSWGFLVAAG